MWGQLGTDGLIDLCSRGHPVLLPQNDQDVDVELDVIHQPFLLLLEDSCHQIWPVLNAGPIQLCLDLIPVGVAGHRDEEVWLVVLVADGHTILELGIVPVKVLESRDRP